MFWIFLGVCFVIFFKYVIIKPYSYWSERGVPQLNVWSLWLRLFRGFLQLKPVAEGFREFYGKFPDCRYAGLYQFFLPTLCLRDPDLIKQITVKDFDHFQDHNLIISADTEPLWEKNLFSLRGEKWREMRATLTPSFTSSKMKSMFGLLCKCAAQFVEHFEEQHAKDEKVITVEMKDVFGRFTTDVIASTAFGITCDSLKNPENEFYKMGKEATNFESLKFIILFVAPKFAKLLGLQFFGEKIRSFFKGIIMDTIKVRQQHNIIRPDMIHLLIEARKGKLKEEIRSEGVDEGFAIMEDSFSATGKEPLNQSLTDDDITAQAFVFFLAGFDTVSSTMCFTAYELAVNMDVQKRLQQEIDETLHKCGGNLTYEALMKMKYLDMVISESLRKWPPAIAADRLCVKCYTIQPERNGEKPVHLHRGDVVFLPIYALHRDPRFYPEPERFDPERFSDENKSKINTYAYIPFGVGPRGCIGNRFAMMEVKIVIFYLLSKFDIVVVEKTAIPLKIGKNPVNLSSENGFWLGLRSRSAKE